jgi:hypothetical protein
VQPHDGSAVVGCLIVTACRSLIQFGSHSHRIATMPKYSVIIPCTMTVLVEVQADDKKQAKEKAFATNFCAEVKNGGELLEFEAHEEIVRGNVFSGVQNEIEVSEIEDDDDC